MLEAAIGVVVGLGLKKLIVAKIPLTVIFA